MRKMILILAVVCALGLVMPHPVSGDGAAVPANLEAQAPFMVEGTVLDATAFQDSDGVIRTNLFVQVTASRGGIAKGSVVNVSVIGGTVGSITMRSGHILYIPATGHKVHLLMENSATPGTYQIWGADYGVRRIQ